MRGPNDSNSENRRFMICKVSTNPEYLFAGSTPDATDCEYQGSGQIKCGCKIIVQYLNYLFFFNRSKLKLALIKNPLLC